MGGVQDHHQPDLAPLGAGRQLHGQHQLRAQDVVARHSDLHVQAVQEEADRHRRGGAHHLQEPEGPLHSLNRGQWGGGSSSVLRANKYVY